MELDEKIRKLYSYIPIATNDNTWISLMGLLEESALSAFYFLIDKSISVKYSLVEEEKNVLKATRATNKAH